MVGAGFKSEHIVAQVVEGHAHLLHPKDYETEDNLFQIDNETR